MLFVQVIDKNMGPKYGAEHQKNVQKWIHDGTFKAVQSVTKGIDNSGEVSSVCWKERTSERQSWKSAPCRALRSRAYQRHFRVGTNEAYWRRFIQRLGFGIISSLWILIKDSMSV